LSLDSGTRQFLFFEIAMSLLLFLRERNINLCFLGMAEDNLQLFVFFIFLQYNKEKSE